MQTDATDPSGIWYCEQLWGPFSAKQLDPAPSASAITFLLLLTVSLGTFL